MKAGFFSALALLGLTAGDSAGIAQTSAVERLQEALAISTADGVFRARVSGTLDLEAYWMESPAPALLEKDEGGLFTPRLSVYLDAQLGPRLYGFAQARLDRGFDPGEGSAELRLDEWAFRYTPWEDGRLNLQLGQFSTVVGNWVRRHGSWENPFINAPLPYEALTAIWDGRAARSTDTLLRWAHLRSDQPRAEFADKHLRLPMLWGPAYTTGAAVSGRAGKVDYAFEVKNASVTSRPESWGAADGGWDAPTFSGRLAFRPNAAWDVGVSASHGSYLTAGAAEALPPGADRDAFSQTLVGVDATFAWRHVQVWAEAFHSRFRIPGVGDAGVLGYYVETRIKVTPVLALAARWNQQAWGRVDDPHSGGRVRWGRDLWRLDLAPTYRLSAYSQVKLQCSLSHEARRRDPWNLLWATQVTTRF